MDFSLTEKKTNRFGCKKCGVSFLILKIPSSLHFCLHFFQYPGHLAFQCRNYLADANRKPIIAGEESSSSSEEDFMTPVRKFF